jgi:SAM-dependent methyltransferase
MPRAPKKPRTDSDADRLKFILQAQEHCDYFLTPLAEPAGKSVLVAGCGAGTEMLWCLRHGAREVVGIDLVEQGPAALHGALAELRLAPGAPFSLLRMGIEQAHRLERRFDLVLSNNVFEHLGDLPGAFAACARLVEPGTGRIAVFTDPLYYSSSGSHLPTGPWEHLWGDPAALRQKLLADLPPGHPLHELELTAYLDEEISLNRMRLGEFLAAIRASDLAILNLRLLRDRRAQDLGGCLDRLEAVRRGGVAITDLLIEGIGVELVRLDRDTRGFPAASTEELLAARRQEELERRCEELARGRAELEEVHAELAREHWELDKRLAAEQAERERWRLLAEQSQREARQHEAAAREVKQVLDTVAASWSFRAGRALTGPARLARSLWQASGRKK